MKILSLRIEGFRSLKASQKIELKKGRSLCLLANNAVRERSTPLLSGPLCALGYAFATDLCGRSEAMPLVLRSPPRLPRCSVPPGAA